MSPELSTAAADREDRDRGQLVLLAAVALAITLVPLALAYLQLGYHDDIHSGAGPPPAGEVERTLDRGLHDAADGIPFDYSWRERSAAADAVRDRLSGTIESITSAGLDRRRAYAIRYNGTHAATWATDRCPGGAERQFGPCTADGGVILQERQDRTHVLGAAFDIEITTPDRVLRVTATVELRAG